MGLRRKSREVVLQLLYQQELNPQLSPTEAVLRYRAHFYPMDEQTYTHRLFFGIFREGGKLDQVLEEFSEHWKISRMGKIDRNILRMAAFEMIHIEDVPPEVSIDEAIEIAKKFGSEESASFINGILDKIIQRLPPAKKELLKSSNVVIPRSENAVILRPEGPKDLAEKKAAGGLEPPNQGFADPSLRPLGYAANKDP